MSDTSPCENTNAIELPRLLSLEEAASILQCHRTTIGRLVAQGELGCIRYSNRPGARMLFTMELLTEFLGRRARRVVNVAITAPSARRRVKPDTDPRSPWENASSTPVRLW